MLPEYVGNFLTDSEIREELDRMEGDYIYDMMKEDALSDNRKIDIDSVTVICSTTMGTYVRFYREDKETLYTNLTQSSTHRIDRMLDKHFNLLTQIVMPTMLFAIYRK
jgi:hypothetical protein